jgi:transcriptional regulator with XRE-family HTH domain
LNLQAPNSFDTKKLEIEAASLPMGTTETGGRFASTAIRMRAVRRASAYPERKDFAEFLGITIPRLSNIENGFPISRDVQDRVIAKLPWVSRDWLVDGNEGGLTVATLQRLAPLVAEESDRTVPRTRSRASGSR